MQPAFFRRYDIMKLLVTYKFANRNAAEFFREIYERGIPDKVRSEKGCVSYEYYLPADGKSDRILLTEEWESAELQKLHLERPHMKLLAEIKQRYVSETVVEVIAERQSSLS